MGLLRFQAAPLVIFCPVSLSEFSTSTVGRYWATDSFENSSFAIQGPVTNISATENRFPGWAVFNERVRPW
jgi:hypothetical protein